MPPAAAAWGPGAAAAAAVAPQQRCRCADPAASSGARASGGRGRGGGACGAPRRGAARRAAAPWLLLALLASAAVVTCLALPEAPGSGQQRAAPRRRALSSGGDDGGGGGEDVGGEDVGGEEDGGGGGGGAAAAPAAAAPAAAAAQPAPSTRELQRPWAEAFPEQWRAYQAALGALTVRGSPLPSHVAALLPASERLNPAQAARGLAYLGSGARLRRVIGQLASGKPVKAAVLGGSISFGSGIEADKGVADWFTLVVKRLGEAFPRANVTGRNGCVPATPSSFMNMWVWG
jgi:hypothetical protein